MHVETSGSGEDVVLLHGWGMNAAVWDGVREKLSARYRVHGVDLPGHGRSPAMGAFTLDNLAARLNERFDTPVHVVGWSLGGMAALRWALDFPDRVKTLVLTASTPRFLTGPAWQGVAPDVLAAFADGLAADYEGTLSRFIALQARGGEAAKETLRSLRNMLFSRGQPSRDALEAGLAILRQEDLRSEVAELSTPLLVVQGDRDTLTPVTTGEWLAAQVPDGRLQVLHGAAHAPFLSHPEVYVSTLLEFLP